MAAPTLLLYPGAGSDREHSSLVEIETALGRSARVERFDFPYRKEGRKAPDRAPKLMASIRDDLSTVSRRRGPLVMGGRSMGGRIASMVAADVDGGGPVAHLAGLVLISYPLHPPGKPENLRVEHFDALEVPCLFISGTRDPFGTPQEFEAAVPAIPGPVDFDWIDGGRHDLRGADRRIAERVEAFVEHVG